MARTAPADYTAISDGALLPIEPLLASTQDALLQNHNHLYLYDLPVVISDDLLSSGDQYASTAQHAGAVTDYEMAYCYRIPVFPGVTGQTLGGAVWARVEGAGQGGTVRVSSSIDNKTMAVSATAYARHTFTSLDLDTSLDQETITVEFKAEHSGDECRMTSIDAWLEAGSSPLAAGVDGNGVYPQDTTSAAADMALPSYRVRRLSANLDIIAERPGVFLTHSEDFRLARSLITTETALRFVRDLSILYGPKSGNLRVHVNGFCDDAAAVFRAWTAGSQLAGGLSIADLPTAAEWAADKDGAWETGQVALTTVTGIGKEILHARAEGSTGNNMDIYSLCVWEER